MTHLMRQVGIGMDGEAFMESELGQAILNRVAERAITAMDKLKSIKPSEYADVHSYVEAVRDLQNEIDKAESFELWLVEIINEGKSIEQQLIEEEQADGDFDHER